MKQISFVARLIFYLIFAVYQLGAFVFTVMVDGHLDLFGLLKYIPKFKFIAFIGIIFLLIEVIWYFVDRRNRREDEDELQHQNDVLKAKIRNLEEAAKTPESKKA